MKFVVLLLLCAGALSLPVNESSNSPEELLLKILEANLQDNDIKSINKPDPKQEDDDVTTVEAVTDQKSDDDQQTVEPNQESVDENSSEVTQQQNSTGEETGTTVNAEVGSITFDPLINVSEIKPNVEVIEDDQLSTPVEVEGEDQYKENIKKESTQNEEISQTKLVKNDNVDDKVEDTTLPGKIILEEITTIPENLLPDYTNLYESIDNIPEKDISIKEVPTEKNNDELKDIMPENPLITPLDTLPQEPYLVEELPVEENDEPQDLMPENPLITPLDTLPQEPYLVEELPIEENDEPQDLMPENPLITPLDTLPQEPYLIKVHPVEENDDREDLMEENPFITPLDTLPQEPDLVEELAIEENDEPQDLMPENPFMTPFDTLPQEPFLVEALPSEDDESQIPMTENQFLFPMDTLSQDSDVVEGFTIREDHPLELENSQDRFDIMNQEVQNIEQVPIDPNRYFEDDQEPYFEKTPMINENSENSPFDFISNLDEFPQNTPQFQSIPPMVERNLGHGSQKLIPIVDDDQDNYPGQMIPDIKEPMFSMNENPDNFRFDSMSNNMNQNQDSFRFDHMSNMDQNQDNFKFNPMSTNMDQNQDNFRFDPMSNMDQNQGNFKFNPMSTNMDQNQDNFRFNPMSNNMNQNAHNFRFNPMSEMNEDDSNMPMNEASNMHFERHPDTKPSFNSHMEYPNFIPNYFLPHLTQLKDKMGVYGEHKDESQRQIPFYRDTLQQPPKRFGWAGEEREDFRETKEPEQFHRQRNHYNTMEQGHSGESTNTPRNIWENFGFPGIPYMNTMENNEDFRFSAPEIVIEYSTKDQPMIENIFKSKKQTQEQTETKTNKNNDSKSKVGEMPNPFYHGDSYTFQNSYYDDPFYFIRKLLKGVNPTSPNYVLSDPVQDPFGNTHQAVFIVLDPNFNNPEVIVEPKPNSEKEEETKIKINNQPTSDVIGMKEKNPPKKDGILLTEFPYNVEIPYAPTYHPSLNFGGFDAIPSISNDQYSPYHYKDSFYPQEHYTPYNTDIYPDPPRHLHQNSGRPHDNNGLMFPLHSQQEFHHRRPVNLANQIFY